MQTVATEMTITEYTIAHVHIDFIESPMAVRPV